MRTRHNIMLRVQCEFFKMNFVFISHHLCRMVSHHIFIALVLKNTDSYSVICRLCGDTAVLRDMSRSDLKERAAVNFMTERALMQIPQYSKYGSFIATTITCKIFGVIY